MRRKPFFRRLGCFFLGFAFLGTIGFIAIAGLIAEALGFMHTPFGDLGPIYPVGIGIFLLMFVVIAWGARSLRRMSMPLDDLLEAARRVADGDYSARVVDEKGPPEVRSLTRTFNQMAERLQIHDQQRRNMLADVTHELRTPLTIIQGNLEGMLDGMYPSDEARLKTVLDETHILSRLINDLRTLALAESGALQLKREPTDLVALVRETVNVFSSQAKAAGIMIETPSEEIPPLEIDPERIREVLSNLLANALRYTPRGGVISIEAVEQVLEEKKSIQVLVQDNGPGIPAEDLPHVFDRFYRSSDSGGMGLGLAIARYLVEAHGGTIRAESQPGKGTTISFALPY